MDAFDRLPRYITEISRPWYECCGCAETETPVDGCDCICHEQPGERGDDEYDPSLDNYKLISIDTGWPFGVRKVWVRPVRVQGKDVILEALDVCPFANGLENEGRHTWRGDMLFSSRVALPLAVYFAAQSDRAGA